MGILWREAEVTRTLAKRPFDCGDADLNEYLRQFSVTNHRRRTTLTLVALPVDDGPRLLGYYSLCPAHVAYDQAPDELRARLPRYPIGGYRLARLAVDQELQHHGLGKQLVLSAGRRALRAAQHGGGSILVIDAKNDTVATWYASLGAQPFPERPLMLVLRLELIAEVLRLPYPPPLASADDSS